MPTAAHCTPTPYAGQATDLSSQGMEKLAASMGLYEEIQRPVAEAEKGLVARLKSIGGLKWASPSFHAEAAARKGDMGGLNIVNVVDAITGKIHAFRMKVQESLKAVGLDKLTEGDPRELQIAYIAERPEVQANAKFMRAQPKIVQDGVALNKSWMDQVADAIGIPRQGRNSAYLAHLFDRRTVAKENALLLEKYKLTLAGKPGGLSPALMKETAALLRDGERVQAAIKAGEDLHTIGLPNAIGKRFLETRTGMGGYSMSFLKTFHSYMGFAERQMFWKPMLEYLNTELLSIKDPTLKTAMVSYLRDNLNLHSPHAEGGATGVVNWLRSAEFHRTIGVGNIGSAMKIVGKTLFSAIEGGPRAFEQGLQIVYHHLQTGGKSYLSQILKDSGAAEFNLPHFTPQDMLGQRTFAQKLIEASGWLFAHAEKGSRTISFYTGLAKWFQGPEAKKLGLTLDRAVEAQAIPQEAIEAARQFVRKTKFVYGAADTPFILRNPIVGMAFQYQVFHIKALELMWKWMVREGAAGRARLGVLLGVGLGMTKLLDMAGLDISRHIPSPFDLMGVLKTIEGLSEGDMEKARRSASGALYESVTKTQYGPSMRGIESLEGLSRLYKQDKLTAKGVTNFMTRELVPVQARKIYDAYKGYLANPDTEKGASEFMTAIAGFPNIASRTRLAYLQAVEDGHRDKAEAIRQAYRRKFGNLPVDFSEVQKAGASHTREALRKRLESARKSYQEKQREKLPSDLARRLL